MVRLLGAVIVGLLTAAASFVGVAFFVFSFFGVCDEGPCQTPAWQGIPVLLLPAVAGIAAGWASWRAAGRRRRSRHVRRLERP